MSKYEMTNEQLDYLQDQARQLTMQNDTKQKLIRGLEFHKARVLNNATADLIMTITRLENEVDELKKANDRLTGEISSNKANTIKLVKLLEEERKLRKYSETFSKDIEFQYGEEFLNRQLTPELFQNQNTEIDTHIERIQESQNKSNKFTNEVENCRITDPKDIKETVNMQNKESSQSIRQLKLITEQLKTLLLDLHKKMENCSVMTSEDHQHVQEIGKWLRETKLIMANINNIEILNKELNSLKQEIENRRKSVLK